MLRLKSTGHLEWALEPSSHLEAITPFKTTVIGTKARPASIQLPYLAQLNATAFIRRWN